MPVPIGTPLKGRRPATGRFPWLGFGLLATVLASAGWWVWQQRASGTAEAAIRGYVEDVGALRDEYARFQGQQLRNQALATQFADATRFAREGNYPAAIAILEPLSLEAPVPAVFNNLGVLYQRANDPARAMNALQAALARDSGYAAARLNLRRMPEIRPDSPIPVTHEVEPNNHRLMANVVPLDAPVEASIQSINDSDFYRFATPKGPRDLIEVRLENRSQGLAPGLLVMDADGGRVGKLDEDVKPGSSVTQMLSPAPGALMYLQVWGQRGSEGAYLLTVKPVHAFDAYEPNDDIFNTPALTTRQTVDANIMDERDTDYYRVEAVGSGKIEIDVVNRSQTLIPALTLYSVDKRFIAFGPDVRKPGASLKYSFEALSGQRYYVQVWSQANTSGAYQLTMR
jgi:hypothetical protein